MKICTMYVNTWRKFLWKKDSFTPHISTIRVFMCSALAGTLGGGGGGGFYYGETSAVHLAWHAMRHGVWAALPSNRDAQISKSWQTLLFLPLPRSLSLPPLSLSLPRRSCTEGVEKEQDDTSPLRSSGPSPPPPHGHTKPPHRHRCYLSEKDI